MEVTVSQVNEYIKRMFEFEPQLNNISVKGEVSNVTYHTSGHIYFTIKDKGSQLSCVMFAGQRAGLAFKMETGQSVIVSGRISVYERDGRYQLYANRIQKAGVGDLYEKFEQLKKKLSNEGLFDAGHKKPIPRYSTKIGVVTASGAAALQDIIKVSKRRNPYVQLFLCPVQVQGQTAAPTIAEGIKKMDDFGVDVIIVGRGGGSIEDLWAFNEECVARACFECRTPIISAVGHEVDTTIIDYVSDMRAATPSMAAELAVFDYFQFESDCNSYIMNMRGVINNRVNNARIKYEAYLKRLEAASPKRRLDRYRQLSDNLKDKLDMIIDNRIKHTRNRLAVFAARLEGVSPVRKLGQGYSYTTDIKGERISSINKVHDGDEIQVIVSDGKINAIVKSSSKFDKEY